MATYACSDLHGNYNVWSKIKAQLKPEDTLYFLGDAADRGNDGWKIIKEVCDMDNVIYIRGNHDQMLLDRYINPEENYYIHECNGGGKTWWDFMADDYTTRMTYIHKFSKKAQLYAIYTRQFDGKKVFMSHSGSTNINDPEALLWDRDHYKLKNWDNKYDFVIHGHTPIEYLIYNELTGAAYTEPYWYDHMRKCDLDACTAATHIALLLDLDDFDNYYAFKG